MPTVGNFADAGKLLEIGCEICGRHGYFTHDQVKLPAQLAMLDAVLLLTCGNCGARNRRLSERFPLWLRPDARVVAGQKGYAPTVDIPGRDWHEQAKYLKMPINAWLAGVRAE